MRTIQLLAFATWYSTLAHAAEQCNSTFKGDNCATLRAESVVELAYCEDAQRCLGGSSSLKPGGVMDFVILVSASNTRVVATFAMNKDVNLYGADVQGKASFQVLYELERLTDVQARSAESNTTAVYCPQGDCEEQAACGSTKCEARQSRQSGRH